MTNRISFLVKTNSEDVDEFVREVQDDMRFIYVCLFDSVGVCEYFCLVFVMWLCAMC